MPVSYAVVKVLLARFALFGIVLVCAGCSTLPSGRGWGEDASISPGWERVGAAAREATTDPWVWAPLIGAAIFQVDDWDRRTADWAREHTPVFGSQRGAERWSDDLKDAAAIVHYTTIAIMPSGETAGEWVWNKAKGSLVHIAAVSATANLTSQLKDVADRTRPNGAAKESFPSGHTSSAAVHGRLASRNVHALELSPGVTRAFDVGLYVLTIGTSWSRIEAGWHYPSDTLVGMAMGHFLGSFFNDAFLPEGSALRLGFSVDREGAMVVFQKALRSN